MSEDEYKELYLKYKVKYINLKSQNNLENNLENNLKNNNQTGGGFLDFFKKATDEDVERINKKYHEEIRKKIELEIPTLLEILKNEMYKSGQDKIEINDNYKKHLDEINELSNSNLSKKTTVSNEYIPTYNDIRIMLNTELNRLIFLTNYKDKDKIHHILFDKMYIFLNTIYNLINEINIKIDKDTLTHLLQQKKYNNNLFKKHLFLTVNQLKLINLILIYGPPNINEIEEDRFIHDELLGNNSSLLANIMHIKSHKSNKFKEHKYMKLMFKFYSSDNYTAPTGHTKIASDNIINFIDILFKDATLKEFDNAFESYLTTRYNKIKNNINNDNVFFNNIYMKPHTIYDSNKDTIKTVKNNLKCFYKTIYNYDGYLWDKSNQIILDCRK